MYDSVNCSSFEQLTLSAELNVKALPVFRFYKVRHSLRVPHVTWYVLVLVVVYFDID
jgi:hypothetical protein